MPLTAGQLTAIGELMNGAEAAPDGIQQLLSRLCEQRDNILSLTKFHQLLTDVTATNVLAALRTNMNITAEALAALIP